MYRDPALHPLSHQHQHGLALTVIIDRQIKADPGDATADELAQKVAAAWENELKGHFQVEEELLFPETRSRLASPALIDDLITQHRELERLAGNVARTQGADRREALLEFGRTLHAHIRLEERQLFQDIQEHLSDEEMKSLGERIDDQVHRVCPVTGRLPWEADQP